MNLGTDEFPRRAAAVGMYVGARQTGKTHLAQLHVAAAAADGRPALLLDSMGADNFAASPHRVESAADAIDRVWKQRRHAVVTPWSDEEASILFAAAADLGDAHLLIDESSEWLNSRRSVRPLRTCLRAPSHRQLTVALTTQHFSGDAPAFLFECGADFFIFRTKGFKARQRLAEEFEDDGLAELVKTLPDRVCVLRR